MKARIFYDAQCGLWCLARYFKHTSRYLHYLSKEEAEYNLNKIRKRRKNAKN